MDESFDDRRLLRGDQLRPLMQKDDARSLTRLAVQTGLFGGLTTVLATCELPTVALAPALLAYGFLIFSLYAPFHECTHRTAFRTGWLNTVFGHLLGLLYGYSLGVHKAFHFTHHRHTNGELDPERGFSLPPMPGRLFLQVGMAGILGALVPLHSLVLAVAPASTWDRLEAGWIAPAKRARLAWECRAVALVWGVGVGALAAWHPRMLATLVVGIVIGRMIHGLVTVIEHEDLPGGGHQLEVTRTTVSNRVFRWFWWNMNFHGEHHTWPGVPWHQLPAAHAAVAPGGALIVEPGYLAFYLRRARGGGGGRVGT